MRDERSRAHPHHLREGERQGHQVRRETHGGDRLPAETSDPVHVCEQVERLPEHTAHEEC